MARLARIGLVAQGVAVEPYGKWLLAVVAAGLFAHIVFCLIQARYREV
jgi:hypothetical protein